MQNDLIQNFKNSYQEHFSVDKEWQIIFEMGGDKEENDRVDQVIERFKQISEYVLAGKDCWIILFIWDNVDESMMDLADCGFTLSKADAVFNMDKIGNVTKVDTINETDEIKYIYYKKYDFDSIKGLIKGIASHELAITPSSGVLAYILTFQDRPVFLNLYDDRGMEFLTHDFDLFNSVKEKFQHYVLKTEKLG